MKNCYKDYPLVGVLVPENATYDEFLALAYTTLELDRENSTIKLEYQVHGIAKIKITE